MNLMDLLFIVSKALNTAAQWGQAIGATGQS